LDFEEQLCNKCLEEERDFQFLRQKEEQARTHEQQLNQIRLQGELDEILAVIAAADDWNKQ